MQHQNTPLAKTIRALKLAELDLAKRIGIHQATLSKALQGRGSKKLAARIVDFLDPDRLLLNELMILYPERYSNWEYPEPEPSKSQQVVSTT